MMKRMTALLLAGALCLGGLNAGWAEEGQQPLSPREDLIEQIIETGHRLFVAANGKLQRAHYAGDIYVCKNFTVHVFNECAGAFRIGAYPDAPLLVPNNLPKDECKPHAYGYCWEDVGPEEGNPFYIAAQFVYDSSLSKQENMEKASGIRGEVKDIAWGSQIRSYVFQPYTMVKDVRTGAETGNVQAVMDGDLDLFINAYLKWATLGEKAAEN